MRVVKVKRRKPSHICSRLAGEEYPFFLRTLNLTAFPHDRPKVVPSL
jgi:hypothetical protein